MKYPAQDKLLHFIAGASICAVVSLVTPVWFACVAGVLAGLAKELADINLPSHTADVMDFWWTALGSGTFYLWLLVYDSLSSI